MERQSAFWSPKTIDFTSENIRVGALGSSWSAKWGNGATWATWRVLTARTLPKHQQNTLQNASAKNDDFLKFPKNKKVRKSHFRVLAYVYEVFGCSERSKPQSGVWSTSEHLGAPKSPKSNFCIRVRRFGVVWEPQMHFWRFWALRSCSDRHGRPRGPDR